MPHLQYHHTADSIDLADMLAQEVGDRLEKAIKDRGKAVLVVSGGSTPKPFFMSLAKRSLDWEKVMVTLADERCVNEQSSQSNARLVKESLLQGPAAAAKLMPLYSEKKTEQEAAEAASDQLAGLPRYDVVILGMGGDGHTASIFPQAVNRDEALDLTQSQQALLVDPVTVTPLRITQTASRLLHTDFLALHITGDEKAELLTKVIDDPRSEKWPIAVFLNQNKTQLHIYSNSPRMNESSSS